MALNPWGSILFRGHPPCRQPDQPMKKSERKNRFLETDPRYNQKVGIPEWGHAEAFRRRQFTACAVQPLTAIK